MPADLLGRLSRWFVAHCDGEREHHHGLSIVSTDNPGWWMKVDLTGTELATRDFAPVCEGLGPHGHPASDRWLHCRVEDGQWQGTGDETRLREILTIFLAWVEA